MNRAKVEECIRPQFTELIYEGRDGRILAAQGGGGAWLDDSDLVAAMSRKNRERWLSELEEGYTALDILGYVWPWKRTLVELIWDGMPMVEFSCSIRELPGSDRRRYIHVGMGLGEDGSVLLAALEPGPAGYPRRRVVESILDGQERALQAEVMGSLPNILRNDVPRHIPRAAIEAALWRWMSANESGSDSAWLGLRDILVRDTIHRSRMETARVARRRAGTEAHGGGAICIPAEPRPGPLTEVEKRQILSEYMHYMYRE